MDTVRSALAIALGLLCAGCFLEELNVSCVDSRKDCYALNVANKVAEDACEIYQCRSDGRGCVLRERDYDGDGYLDPQSCSDRDAKRLDCNDDPDGGADFHPAMEEKCDGLDNNCNGWIDEGVLVDGSTFTEQVALGMVDAISYSEASDGLLNVASTHVEESIAYTTLRVLSEPVSISPLQARGDNCRRSNGFTGHCTLRDIAIARTDDALIAVGVQTLGCAGTLRVASRSLNDNAELSWDGDKSGSSNLRQGVASESACLSGANTAHSPSIAVSGQGALVTWRAVRGAPSELLGIGLAIESAGGSDPRLWGLGGAHPVSLSGPNLGLDGAAIQAATRGFFVAYDVPNGLEVAHLPDVQENVDEVFARARRLPIRSPGASRVALALASGGARGEALLGLAWRVVEGNRGRLLFYRPTWANGSLTESDSLLTLRADADIRDGPAITYVEDGFRDDPETGREGGWFVAWTEQEGLQHTLLGVRVSRGGDRALEAPFVLARDDLVSHPYVRQTDGHIGFAFASGKPEGSLNIGSLACGP